MLSALILTLSTASGYSVAAPGLVLSDIDERAGTAFVDYLVQQLQKEVPVKVLTKNEIATMIGVERQKQLLGCSDASSCLAELTGALDTDAVLSGSLARTQSKGWVLSLKLLDARHYGTIATYSTRAATDDALYDSLGDAARQLAAGLVQQHPELAVSRRHWAWIPAAVVAIAAVIAGTGLLVSGKLEYGRLSGSMPIDGVSTTTDLDVWIASGRAREQAGVGLLITGAVVAVVAVLLFVMLKTESL